MSQLTNQDSDSGVNSMDFHEKLKNPEDNQMPAPAQPPKTYRYQSQSCDRAPSTQINVPARTRIRSARTRAANIRSRSRGMDFKIFIII